MRRTGFLLSMLLLVTLPVKADASRPLSLPSEAQLRALQDDPQVQQASDAWMQGSREAVRVHLRQLAKNGKPRELLAASVLWSGLGLAADTPEQAEQQFGKAPAAEAAQWFDAARAAAPNDVLVNWVEATQCDFLSRNCDASAAAQRLQQLDADNVATWLLTLARASRADSARRDAAWARAAAATKFDTHYLELSGLLQKALAKVDHPPMSTEVAALLGASFGLKRPAVAQDVGNMGVIGMLSALYLPALNEPSQRCRGASVQKIESRREQCEHLLTLLANDQSVLISPMIALPLRVQLAGDGADAAQWRERLRQFHWQYENAMKRLADREEGQPMPVEYADWFMQGGELAAMRRLLASEGVAEQAPADWLPSDARIRALVQTGRE